MKTSRKLLLPYKHVYKPQPKPQLVQLVICALFATATLIVIL